MKSIDMNCSPVTFSIIIPTYNRAPLVKDLLTSLLNQTYKEFEIIICDDGSTDNTPEIVSSFTDKLKITYLTFKNTGGPAYPRNRGIEVASNEWLCFLDSDDLWTNDKLQILAEYIHISNSLVYCHPVYLSDKQNNKIGVIGKYRKAFFLNDFESILYNGSQIVNSSLCVNRSILAEGLFYNTDPEYHAIEDYIFILNIAYSGYVIKCIPRILGYYRIHDSNISADLTKQLSKWKKYFATRPFQKVNYDTVENLILYLETGMDIFTTFEKIRNYKKVLFTKNSSLEIKKKSFGKLLLNILKLVKPIENK